MPKRNAGCQDFATGKPDWNVTFDNYLNDSSLIEQGNSRAQLC